VLPVSALKLGDPVTISVDMVANDLSLHINITTVEGEGAEWGEVRMSVRLPLVMDRRPDGQGGSCCAGFAAPLRQTLGVAARRPLNGGDSSASTAACPGEPSAWHICALRVKGALEPLI
jgi:hypothetical protein